MNAWDGKSGIVLKCDPSGEILHVIRDDFGITAGRNSPSTLFGIVDPQSREKAEEFLHAAIEAHATFSWELNVHCDGLLMGLLLHGGVSDNGIIICGSPSRTGLCKLFDEMAKIQNEQLSVLRKSLKEERLAAAPHHQREHALLEEFTRLNNELVNTQRELARRNVDLADANVQLESLATTDGLTGLKNHRVFQETLEQEFNRAVRYRAPLSVLMIDVDHFKQFNDRFGHPAGDGALKRVARSLAEGRADTLVARYGGEEFAMVLPNCGSDEAAAVAERVRRNVALGPWELRPITVSVGTSTTDDGTERSATLIVQADAAMYRAKISGGNQVCSNGNVCDTAKALTTSPAGLVKRAR